MAQTHSSPSISSRGRPRSFDREKALDQAMQVFWEKGYVATSLTDLTTAMGIAAPSLYAAFGSKEALFALTLERYDARVRELMQASFENGQSLRDQVEASLRLSARIEDAITPTGCMVMMACEQRDALSPELNTRLMQQRVLGAKLLQQRLEKAVENGELPPQTDTAALTQFYATLQRGLSVSRKTGASAQELEASIDMAMRAWDGLTRI